MVMDSRLRILKKRNLQEDYKEKFLISICKMRLFIVPVDYVFARNVIYRYNNVYENPFVKQ